MCLHKRKEPLYARTDKSWISTKKICGTMIYICMDCGAILEPSIEQEKVEEGQVLETIDEEVYDSEDEESKEYE